MVEIIPYQDRWSAEFTEIGSILHKGLGKLALRIDHIGSTAVLGLAAQDVIDVQITVISLGREVHQAMLALGYTRVGGISCDHHPPHTTNNETSGKSGISDHPRFNVQRMPICG